MNNILETWKKCSNNMSLIVHWAKYVWNCCKTTLEIHYAHNIIKKKIVQFISDIYLIFAKENVFDLEKRNKWIVCE